MHHTAPWYLPWGLKLVPLPIPPGHPASGIPNPAGLHLLAPLPGIYAPEPRKVDIKPLRDATVAVPAPKIAVKRKAEDADASKDLKKAKLETKALKAKRPGFTDERYNETSYYVEHGLRKVYPYYFTFTTFTKGRWVGEKILEVFAREFRAHPAEEYERCIRAGTLTVNYQKVDVDYRLRHNDLLANVVHRHEVPVTSEPITVIHMDEDVVVVNKPASIPVHPCGRYRHNTVVFILAKEYNLKNLRTIHRLDRLTSGILLFGRTPKKARQMEHQIRNRQVHKQYVCRVEGEFPEEEVICSEPIEVVSYKIGVCKVSEKGKDCVTRFKRLSYNGKSSVVLCKPQTGRMHQIRVHLQYLGYPVVNDPLYNHVVFGPHKGKGGNIGKTDEELVRDLISIHNAENWLGMDGDSDMSLFKPKLELEERMLASGNDKDGSSPSSTPGLVEDEQQQQQQQKSLKVTVGTQTGSEPPDSTFANDKVTVDPHCYECKVKYRDPKPSDLVMYLHAWRYCGPGWEYETPLPAWAASDWTGGDDR
ncbi:RNA pseudouridylate synthase domain-containing protein 2 isoform X2 [Ooceraea biroi]|uniref:Pseudouridylate synthase RPUSD2 n=1 Tax=Ooceraea biroi TaxID=2015173 RepID=A0A026WTE9_OOCBI|nr:RNA pseudouridylate synthase domain-containing protein 2 isoform X2 [Ooceraea biroi]XP_011330917.1 RNA pseudouridylate synthase domain-containing protein 2 isoform X2 [Ooceraea biroi]XP_011330918.1 RNA pseudouridylate synthase domain-containing protein 2 isoform X2 [Ooceraea biroi]XP_011330919.1 RNA pseudouridylate synthase domain-containing protein 2 isoform X2 [Ooceraea biroi]XP_026827769.1 RNA pseudouridylate synthase domain-containing protein 2 isoform X2 [Ooceraea biroi]EZA59228.1 RNA 